MTTDGIPNSTPTDCKWLGSIRDTASVPSPNANTVWPQKRISRPEYGSVNWEYSANAVPARAIADSTYVDVVGAGYSTMAITSPQ